MRKTDGRRVGWLLAGVSVLGWAVAAWPLRSTDLAASVVPARVRAISTRVSDATLSGSSPVTPAQSAEEALAHALQASAVPRTWPALTGEGRLAWSGVAPPNAAPRVEAPEDKPADVEVPFQWVGLLESSSASGARSSAPPTAILADANTTRFVQAGDMVDEDWKILAVTADVLRVSHLPTATVRVLSISRP